MRAAAERGMAFLARNVAAFLVTLWVGSLLFVAVAHFLTGTNFNSGGVPFFFFGLAMVGAYWVVVSFVHASRSREGEKPKFPMVVFACLFFSFTVVIAVSLLIRLENIYPAFALGIPPWALYALRDSAFVLLFAAGWGLRFGSSRGWFDLEVDPKPLGFFFRRVDVPDADGNTAEDEGDE